MSLKGQLWRVFFCFVFLHVPCVLSGEMGGGHRFENRTKRITSRRRISRSITRYYCCKSNRVRVYFRITPYDIIANYQVITVVVSVYFRITPYESLPGYERYHISRGRIVIVSCLLGSRIRMYSTPGRSRGI